MLPPFGTVYQKVWHLVRCMDQKHVVMCASSKLFPSRILLNIRGMPNDPISTFSEELFVI